MRAVVQRVRQASVTVKGAEIGSIGAGLLALVGVATGDGDDDARLLASKIAGLRIFSDEAGRFNLSVQETGGAVLVVSQFTLLGDARKGRRPNFTAAAAPDVARPLVDRVTDLLRAAGLPVATGEFGAHMDVTLTNDGPVTILLDTRS